MAQKANITELKQTGQMVARQAGMGSVKKFFEANKSAMAAVLPKHVTADRMLRIAFGAMRSTPALMNATTESLMSSVMVCAQLGLEPNTVLGHAYLIPFNNRKEQRTDVQVVIGYKGLIDLARRSGQVVSLAAHAVYENDHFDFAYGLEERLEHKPAMNAEGRGQIVAFYAVAKLKDGGYAFEVMSKAQVDVVKLGTQSKGNYGPWKDHYEEMGRKTVIRRLAKYLPLSIEFATAAALDGLAEAGKDQHLETALDGEFSVVPEDAPADEEGDGVIEQEEAPAVATGEGPTVEDLIASTKAAKTIQDLDDIEASMGHLNKRLGPVKALQQAIDNKRSALIDEAAGE